MADTDPRSADTLAKALCHVLAWDWAESVSRLGAVNLAEQLAAHPAMQARDAALVQQAEAPYVDEGGLPRHVPIGLTADNRGPTEPDPPHHRACWCDDAECSWTRALAAERKGGRDEVAAAVEAVCATARFAASIAPLDCNRSCDYGPCSCSGLRRAVAWDLDPEAIRAAVAAAGASDLADGDD